MSARYVVARIHVQSGHVSTFTAPTGAKTRARLACWNARRHVAYTWRYAVLGIVEVAS